MLQESDTISMLCSSEKRNKNKNENKIQTTTCGMINAYYAEWDCAAEPTTLPKLEDPGAPTIHCAINQFNFYNTVFDTGSGSNLMAKVTYELIFGKLTLHRTYTKLQMADQTFRSKKELPRMYQ